MSAHPDSGIDLLGVVEPTRSDVEAARTVFPAVQRLVHRVRRGSKEAVQVDVVDLRLPVALVSVVARMVEKLAEGHAVSASSVDEHSELSTQQAADLLRISRPTLIRLLEREEIAYRMAGSHRRVDLASLLTYQARARGGTSSRELRDERLAGLREMAEFTNELGLGY